MDDRGTRPFRNKPEDRCPPDDGNYIGDPNKPDETIRAGDETEDGQDENWLPASDAPTIIRDLPR
jgi:hypothetical protein